MFEVLLQSPPQVDKVSDVILKVLRMELKYEYELFINLSFRYEPPHGPSLKLLANVKKERELEENKEPEQNEQQQRRPQN